MMDKRRLRDFKQNYQEKIQHRKQILFDLKEDYKALWEQYRGTSNAADRNSLKRQIENKEQEIEKTKNEIDEIDNSWLKEILVKIGDLDIIKQAYLDCRPRDYPQEQDNLIPGNSDNIEDIVKDIINNLEKMPLTPQGYSRFWLFVTYLSVEPSEKLLEQSKVPEFIKDELKSQIQKQVDEDWIELQEAVQTIRKNRNLVKPYLMIEVKPAIQEKRFFVHAWLLSNHTCDSSHEFLDIVPSLSIDITLRDPALKEKESELANNSLLQKRERESFDWQELQNLIDQMIELSMGILHRQSKNSDLTIEFFLPKDLLTEPVDSWKPYNEDSSGFSIPIGYDYQVIVRSYERLRPRYRARYRWFEKWRQVKRYQTQPANQWFLPITECPGDPTILCYQLDDENLLGCTLKSDPVETSKNIFVEPINHAGTPIVIWLRRNLNHFNDQVTQLLNNAIADLPEAVRNQRREARKEQASLEEHIGYHLSLWWDNPNRLPPEKTFKT
jgi:hypothetical protein